MLPFLMNAYNDGTAVRLHNSDGNRSIDAVDIRKKGF